MMSSDTGWPSRASAILLILLTLTACGAPQAPGNRGSPSTPAASAIAAGTIPLDVTPAAGLTGTTFVIAAAGLPGNAALHILGRGPDQAIVLSLPTTSRPDGTLSLDFNSLGQPPGMYSVIVAQDLRVATQDRALARGTFMIMPGGEAPTLTIEPNLGPCATPEPAVLARGRNFPPDAYLGLSVTHVASNRTIGGAQVVVAGDGTFAAVVRLAGCGPTTPDGTQFRIGAVRLQGPVDTHGGLASATFTASASAPPLPALPTPSPDPR